MLRITENFEHGETLRLRLDGTISTDTLSELTDALSIHYGAGEGIVTLDMAGVAFMDDTVAHKLVTMRNERLRIINCSPFIATLLESATKGNDE